MALNYISAAEAASYIKDGQSIGLGGFASAGCPKAITPQIALKAQEEHAAGRPFKIDVITGASVGNSCDGLLTEAEAIGRRYPFCINSQIREAINKGIVQFEDLNLSDNAQYLRLGLLGALDYGIVEASAVEEVNGGRVRIYFTQGIGIAPSIIHSAHRGIFIELNTWHSPNIQGIHDIYELELPWERTPIHITYPTEIIGKPYIEVPANKILGVVEVNIPNDQAALTPGNEIFDQIGENVASFFLDNINFGMIDKDRLVLQSGVGSGANAVLAAMAQNPDIPYFNIYTEVLQQTALDLLMEGHIRQASTASVNCSNEELQNFYSKIDDYKGRLVIRPSEISNCPEIVTRLGLCSLNTALEVDIYGHVNSTKVLGTSMMNGVGGSCDFTCHSMLSTFTCPSVAKDGKISSIVPFCSHIDHTEHYVDAIVTEYGVADLRAKTPLERAQALIAIAHPDYRGLLNDYLKISEKYGGQTHHVLSAAFAMHDTFRRKGDMRLTDWSEYIKD